MEIFPAETVITDKSYWCDDCKSSSTFYILAEEYHVLTHKVKFFLWCTNCYNKDKETCVYYTNTVPFSYWVSYRSKATRRDEN